jgi:hypothetical protein
MAGREAAVDRASYGQPDDERRVRMMVAAQYDAPAYVRRARGVESSFETLMEQCRKKRAEWLLGVRLYVGALHAAGDWVELRRLLTDDGELTVLHRLHAEAGDPEVPMTGPTDDRGRRRTLLRLRASVERFNRRWVAFVAVLDLSEVNRLRDDYNRYYLLERECAVGPDRRAQQSFRRLPPLTTADILAELPPLPVPQLAA